MRVRLIAPLAHALASLTPLEDATAAFPAALEASGFEGGVFFGVELDGSPVVRAAHGVVPGDELFDLARLPTFRVVATPLAGWSTALTTPLIARGERVGHLVLLSRQPIDGDSIEIARVLASQLAAVCVAPRTTAPAPVSLTAAELLESIPEAFMAFDEKWVIVDVNTRAVEMLGRSRGELVGKTIPQTFPTFIGTEAMHQLERAMKERVPIELEYESALVAGRFIEARIFPTGAGLAVFFRDVTRRVLGVRALEASEAHHRAIFEHALDGLMVTSPDGAIHQANPAAREMLGRTEEEIIRAGRDGIVDQSDPRLAVMLAERTRRGRARGELTMIRGDGTKFEAELSTVFFRDELGRERTSLSFRDITRRRQAEQRLVEAHEGEQHLRRQLEAISNATVAVSESVARLPQSEIGVVLRSVVLQAQLITGARYGAIGIGTDPDKPFDPWVSLGVPRETARAIGRSPRPRGLLGVVAIDGKSVRVDGMNQAPFPAGHPPMRTLLGVPLRYMGKPVGNLYLSDKEDDTAFTADDQRAVEILADRVAIALATARLYEAEARERSWLKITIDQMPEPVILGDAQGAVTSWNDAAEPLATDDPSREHGMPFDLRRPTGEPLPWEEHPLHRAGVRGELVSAVELIAVARDGSRVPVLASASPLPRDESGLHGAVAILQDITRHKEVERLREEWTAIVAHDLRQPAALVSLAAELLHRRHLGSEDEKLVERIRSGAGRLRKMIEDLLDYAQIEAGHLRIAPRSVDVTALVCEVVERVGQTAQGRPVRLVRDGVARAEVDPDRIDQVVTNLLSNAVKYGASGTDITVAIEARPGEIEIAVTNRGPGLSRDELGKLFAKFHRAKSASAAGAKGIGLGLFITKGIVEAHGGRIWAESTPSETTTFHVVLPLHPQA
ncbi:MAG: PAS domain S-box protein [Polyangiales bacterium]